MVRALAFPLKASGSARRAFTLLELVVATVILGILGAVALTTGTRVVAGAQDASVETTVAALAREAGALAALQGTFTSGAEEFLAAGEDLKYGAVAGSWAATNPVVLGGPRTLAEARWGKVYVLVTPDGQSAGVAAVSQTGHCVRAKVSYPKDIDVFTTKRALGLNCSPGEAVKGAPGTDPLTGGATGASTEFDDGRPAAVAYVAPTARVHRIDVAWETSPRATSYQLSRATSSEGPFTPLATLPTTTYRDEAVDIHSAYTYRVVAVNEAGTSGPTDGGPVSPLPIERTLGASKSVETFTVPAGVERLTILAYGGQGGLGAQAAGPKGWDGGSYGGLTTTTLRVTPGEVFSVAVGSRGGDSNPSSVGEPGWGLRSPGGAGGTGTVSSGGRSGTLRAGGGGGATEVYRSSTAASNWILTAGGGGGCGHDPAAPSTRCSRDTYGGSGGGSGGDGTTKSPSVPAGTGGSRNVGTGAPGSSSNPGHPGGGGGGGCKGGTGGGVGTGTNSAGAGGGGGSGCLAPGVQGTTTTSTHTGDGEVVFRW